MKESQGNPRYKRIVLKLSGEALAGARGYGIDLDIVRVISEEILDVHRLGIDTAVVVGGISGAVFRLRQRVRIEPPQIIWGCL